MTVHRLPELSTWFLLDHVDREGSLGAAARSSGVSQQAVSAKVRAAERTLGIELFRRSPQGVTTTAVGRRVLDAAGSLLDEARSLAEVVDESRGDVSRRLRVSASNTVVEHYLPAWTGEVLRTSPHVRIDVVAANSRDVLRDVASGGVDLGFIETPDPLQGEPEADGLSEESRRRGGLTARTVAWDRIVLAVVPEHPWTDMPPSLSELRQTAVLLREDGSGTRRAVEQALPGLTAPAAEVGSLSALWRTASETGIPAFLPLKAMADPLVRVDVEGLTVGRPIRAVWRKRHRLTTLAEALVSAAEDTESVSWG